MFQQRVAPIALHLMEVCNHFMDIIQHEVFGRYSHSQRVEMIERLLTTGRTISGDSIMFADYRYTYNLPTWFCQEIVNIKSNNRTADEARN